MKEAFDTQQLLTLAGEGRLTKHALGTMLVPEARRQFLESCAALEKQYTDECAATNDPCLESGCSVRGEICLQPVLRAGTEYHKACAAEWAKLFAREANRLR